MKGEDVGNWFSKALSKLPGLGSEASGAVIEGMGGEEEGGTLSAPSSTMSDTKASRTVGAGPEFTYAQAAAMLGSLGVSHPKKTQTYEQYAKLYGESVWVYACVYLIATSIAGVPLKLYKKGNKGKEEEITDLNHPIKKVFANPNPFMSEYELKEAVVSNLELLGNSYIEEVRVKDSNIPYELYPLQGHRVKIIPHPTQMVAGYVYTVAGKNITFNPSEITHIKSFNPLSDFYGHGSLASVETATAADVKAAKYNENFFKNSARPDGVLETEQNMNKGITQRLRSQWNSIYRGPSRAHKVAILEGGLKYRQISMSTKDMDFINLRKLNREEIFVAYGVPPALLGILERAVQSNMQEQRRNFWENTLLPKMTRIEAALNKNFVEPYDDSVVLKFDLDAIEALKESREARARIAAMSVDRGIMTINEVRKIHYGMPPVDWGYTWYQPMNLIAVDHEGTGQGTGRSQGTDVPGRERGRSAPGQGTIKPKPGKSSYDDIYASHIGEDGEIVVENPAGKGLPVVTDKQDKQSVAARKKAFEELHTKHEDEFVKLINKVYKKQGKKVLAAIKAGTVNPGDLERIMESDDTLVQSLAEDMYQKIVKDAGTNAMEEVAEQAEDILNE